MSEKLLELVMLRLWLGLQKRRKKKKRDGVLLGSSPSLLSLILLDVSLFQYGHSKDTTFKRLQQRNSILHMQLTSLEVIKTLTPYHYYYHHAILF